MPRASLTDPQHLSPRGPLPGDLSYAPHLLLLAPSHEDLMVDPPAGPRPPLLPSPCTGTCSVAFWGGWGGGQGNPRRFPKRPDKYRAPPQLPSSPVLRGSLPSHGDGGGLPILPVLLSTLPPAAPRRCHCQLLSQTIKGGHPSLVEAGAVRSPGGSSLRMCGQHREEKTGRGGVRCWPELGHHCSGPTPPELGQGE